MSEHVCRVFPGDVAEIEIVEGMYAQTILSACVVESLSTVLILRLDDREDGPFDLEKGLALQLCFPSLYADEVFPSFVEAQTVYGRSLLIVANPDAVERVRRAHSRWNFHLPLRFRLLDRTAFAPERVLTSTVDVSGGGVGFLSDIRLALGMLVELHLRLEKGVTVVAIAEVVRIRECCSGDLGESGGRRAESVQSVAQNGQGGMAESALDRGEWQAQADDGDREAGDLAGDHAADIRGDWLIGARFLVIEELDRALVEKHVREALVGELQAPVSLLAGRKTSAHFAENVGQREPVMQEGRKSGEGGAVL